MATQTSYKLPREIFIIIISNLSLRELATASLVSRTLHDLALPYLYHDVYFSLLVHVENFESRLARDGKKKQSARRYIRSLTLETPRKNSAIEVGEGAIAERDLYRVYFIVLSLTRLRHLSWNLPFFPKEPCVIEILQRDFDLKSVSWLIKQGENDLGYDLDHYYSLFNFQNLTQFTLSLDYTIMHDEEPNLLDPVPDLIKSCPNLESFTLCLQDVYEQDVVIPVRTLAAALNDTVFPSLHTFRIHGPVDPDWHGFFNQPDSHPLRAFFARHPGLRTVGIGSIDGPPYPQPAGPEDLAQLFPSLTHLEAPSFVCGPIVSSRLSSQLQSLVVLYNDRVIYEPDLDIVAQAIVPLPKLRRLAIHGNSAHYFSCICVGPLITVLDAMPALEELALHTWLADPDRLFDVLRLAPGLRILGVEATGGEDQPVLVELLESVSLLLQVCPQLERINLITAYETTESWSIGKKLDGSPVLTGVVPCSWPTTEYSV